MNKKLLAAILAALCMTTEATARTSPNERPNCFRCIPDEVPAPGYPRQPCLECCESCAATHCDPYCDHPGLCADCVADTEERCYFERCWEQIVEDWELRISYVVPAPPIVTCAADPF